MNTFSHKGFDKYTNKTNFLSRTQMCNILTS